MKLSSRFFNNRDCEFFPCHDVDDLDEFNCLFCYCPLYPLGKSCGGNFKYTLKGVKDCSRCNIPHIKHGYDHVRSKIDDVIDLVKEHK